MKFSTSLVLVFLSLYLGAQQTYNREQLQKFPDYAAVVEHYALINPTYLKLPPSLFQFEKKYDGWYIRQYDSRNYPQTLNYRVLWSNKTQNFLAVPKDSSLDAQQQQILRSRQQHYNEVLYRTCPLFGYDEAYNEIINLLKDEQELEASELECLARAYSFEARFLISPQQSTGSFCNYDSSFSVDAFSDKQLDEFEKLGNKAISTFRRVKDKAPDYKTIVGSIDMKIANEQMSNYYNLMIVQQTKRAKKFATKDLYSPVILENAKNMLKSCDQGAILFTGGDNDTYPILYLQEVLNFRKDVTIVNMPLLNLGRYVHYIQNVLPATKRPRFHRSAENYKLSKSNSLFLQDKQASIALETFFEATNKDPKAYQDTLPGKGKVQLMQFLPSFNFTLCKDNPLKLSTNRNYLLKEEIAILDIISANNWKRPIYFGMGVPNLGRWGLKRYLQLEGLAYRLVWEEQNPQSGVIIINPEVLDQKLTKEFTYTFPETQDWDLDEYKGMGHQYSVALYYLSAHYAESKDQNKLLDFIGWMHKQFPIETYPYGSGHLTFAFLCDDVGLSPLVGQHLEAFADAIDKEIKSFEATKHRTPQEQERNKNEIRQNIGFLLNTTQELRLEDLNKRYKARFVAYLY